MDGLGIRCCQASLLIAEAVYEDVAVYWDLPPQPLVAQRWAKGSITRMVMYSIGSGLTLLVFWCPACKRNG